MGYGVVVLESHAAASAFGRRRETEMLGRLSKVAGGVALVLRRLPGRRRRLAGPGDAGPVRGLRHRRSSLELALLVAGALILGSEVRRRQPGRQVLAALLLVLGGTVYRFNTYLVAFHPGRTGATSRPCRSC